MLPTPSTSHVPYDRVYEPAEDSYLLLDTISSPAETAFLQARFKSTPSPLICEIGCGSGVVLGFVTAQAQTIFGRTDVLSLGTDLNSFACRASAETVKRALAESAESQEAAVPNFLGTTTSDLTAGLRCGSVDVLIFNPPYVPAPLPAAIEAACHNQDSDALSSSQSFDRDSYLLSLSYAGGEDGMEVTNVLLDQLPSVLSCDGGVAYVLFCAQNRPEEVKARIASWPGKWSATAVGSSGKKAGWEKLVILRICRTPPP